MNSEGSCSSTCSDFKNVKHWPREQDASYDASLMNYPSIYCNGVLRDCEEISNSKAVLCLNNVIILDEI